MEFTLNFVEFAVRIAGAESYEGILLQARINGSDMVVGTFSGANLPNGIKLLICTADNDTIVHDNNTVAKDNNTEYEWLADDGRTDVIVFV